MAHEIATRDGKHQMMYAGTAPWHGLGTRLDGLATAAEAMTAAGLDFQVESLPVYAKWPDGREVLIPDRVFNCRKGEGAESDTVPLGLVSDKYKVVQNHEAFGFMDALVAEGQMMYETAGALGKGERVWMLGKMPGHVRVKGTDDVTDQYLLLYNSHDASSALRIAFTPIRVVCANTVRAAFRGIADGGAKINHTGDLMTKVEEARAALRLASHYFNVFGEGAQLLASCKPTRAALESYWKLLYPDPEEGKDAGKARSTRMTLTGLFEQGMGQDIPGIRHTAWAAYNAVTEYVDHHLGRSPAKRLESAWWGKGARLKARAWEGAIAMAEGRDVSLLPAFDEAAEEAAMN